MGFLAGLASWLFGGGGAQTVATAVDKAVYTDQEQAADADKDLASARAFYGASNQPGLINQLVDAANRCIRPGVTLMVLGGVMGWWTLPDPKIIGDYWQSVLYLILTFWFGGRMLLKDLPAAIKAFRG